MRYQPRRLIRAERSDSARALDKHLRELGTSVPAWCEKHGIDRLLVQKLLDGRTTRGGLDALIKIRDASGGRVPLEGWAESTVRWDRPGEVVPEERATGT